jgi:lysine 2,3-aminomutase
MNPEVAGSQRAAGTNMPESTSELAGENDEEPPSLAPSNLRENVATLPEIAPRLRGKVALFPAARSRPLSSPRANAFRKSFFAATTDREWSDWQWQIRNRIRNLDQLDRMLALTPEERSAVELSQAKLPIGITPYFMSLISRDDPEDPLRRTVIPTVAELTRMPGESDDPLGEDGQSPVPGLVHRYPDRVLLLVLDFCSTYCRYCTRSRVVGHGAIYPSRSRLERAIEYIRSKPEVRDVLISGGDPLTLNDERLNWLLARLREIPHVEIIRIGTKVPAVLPQRITTDLVRILKHYHPLWMSLHFTHPGECTPEAVRACERLANAGIPLGSQTVLLKGINDSVETMKALCQRMLRMRVRPYYIYQCDPISGSGHFRTPVEKGLEIIRGLRGFTSGYAVPTYVIDAPGGGGKIPINPDYVEGREGGDWLLRNYCDGRFRYPDVIAP